jgi:hypothetical protein
MSKALSNKLEDAIHFCRGRKELIFWDFLEVLGPAGSAILTLIFSIPFLFLAWIPGLNMVFAAIIFISGIRIALNKPIWVPRIIKRRKISGDKMAHRLVKWVKFFKKVEKTIHPRGTIYQQSPFLQTFNGFVLSLCGFFLFLPLTPFSNFLPALAVFLLSVGILEEDLWVMIAAYAVLIIRVILLFLHQVAPMS